MERITREQAQDMAQAHAEGWHAELPREGCPECENRPLTDYPLADEREAPGAYFASSQERKMGADTFVAVVSPYGEIIAWVRKDTVVTVVAALNTEAADA